MNHTFNRRSSIFLTEMIIAILFFSLVSAMCLRIFSKAQQINDSTRNRTMAVIQAQNAAELIKLSLSDLAANGSAPHPFEDGIFEEYPKAETRDDGSIAVYFDHNWSHCTKAAACYCMEIFRTGEPRLYTFQIGIQDLSSENLPTVYSLEFQMHVPNEILSGRQS